MPFELWMWPTAFFLQENYAGGLASHAGDGMWDEGVRQDGWFRRGLPFEPLCNYTHTCLPAHLHVCLPACLPACLLLLQAGK
jgi:hypothetical protein